MAEAFIDKNLADERIQIQAYISSLVRDLEQSRRDLSAIVEALKLYRHLPDGSLKIVARDKKAGWLTMFVYKRE